MARRLQRVLEGTVFPFFTLGGNAGAVALVLARHARIAIFITACLPVIAGLLQSRLALQRGRREGLRQLHRELQGERGVGRLCLTVGILVLLMTLFLSVAITVIVAFLVTTLAFLRTFAVVADSAIREDDLEIDGLSVAQECSCVARWARRLTTLPGRLGKYLAKAARATPPIGELTRLRALPVGLIASSVLVFAVIGSALGAEGAMEGPGKGPPSVATEPDSTVSVTSGGGVEEEGVEEGEETYADLCSELPNPLDIGHGIGPLFRYDGAFKAGCGTKARRVRETGAWFAAGICAGQLRSVAVSTQDDKALLYGEGAWFAWQAAQHGELASAEVEHPAGGDVYAVETTAGTYGFARTASGSGSGSGKLHDCREVTGTARPFAKLPPPMLRLWRDLVEWRAAWSWPLHEDTTGGAIAFVAYPSGALTARGACVGDFSCYLEVDGDRWPGDETAYVSLGELAPYMPPPDS